MNSTSPEDFIQALGVTIRYTEPGEGCAHTTNACASYNADTMSLHLCNNLCPGRHQLAIDLALERVDNAR